MVKRKRVWVCWWVKKEKAQKSRGRRCVLLTGRYQLRAAFETIALVPGQANQERSSAVVKRDRLSSIDITVRAVDEVVPESGLVGLGRTPWSPWTKPSPPRICALAVAVTSRWRIALHSRLLPAERGWSARSVRICFITQTRSAHTHAAQQTVGPLHPRLHFHRTICFKLQRPLAFLSTNGSDRHSIDGFEAPIHATLTSPSKPYSPQNGMGATSTWRSFSWRRDECVLAGVPHRCEYSAVHAQAGFPTGVTTPCGYSCPEWQSVLPDFAPSLPVGSGALHARLSGSGTPATACIALTAVQ